jgi:hypothetical protein
MSEMQGYLSGIGSRIDNLQNEFKQLWYKADRVDKQLGWLVLTAIFTAVLLLINVIHHW